MSFSDLSIQLCKKCALGNCLILGADIWGRCVTQTACQSIKVMQKVNESRAWERKCEILLIESTLILFFCSALQSQMSALSKSVNTCLSLCESLSVTVPSARELSGSAVWAGSSKALLPSRRFPHCPFLITEESLASVLSHSAHRTKKSQLIINVIMTCNCWSCTQHLSLRIVNRPASSYV